MKTIINTFFSYKSKGFFFSTYTIFYMSTLHKFALIKFLFKGLHADIIFCKVFNHTPSIDKFATYFLFTDVSVSFQGKSISPYDNIGKKKVGLDSESPLYMMVPRPETSHHPRIGSRFLLSLFC